jgi:hypothetical protein
VIEVEDVWFANFGGFVKKVKTCVGQLGENLNFMMKLFDEVQEYV